MKVKIRVAIVVTITFLFLAGTIYAANGDLVVQGNLTVSGTVSAPNIMTKYYQSAEQPITSAGNLILPHGMGTPPLLVQVWAKCIIAELGYNVGDMLVLNPSVQEAATWRGISITVDATNIYVKFGNSAAALAAMDKSTGVATGIHNPNWKVIFRALAI